MAGKKEKRFREIKRSHAWVSIFVFVIVMIAANIVIALFATSFINYIIDQKVTDEFNTVRYMTMLYDDSQSRGGNDTADILAVSGRSYRVTSADGTVLFGNGEYTVGEQGGYLQLSRFSEKIYIIADESLPLTFSGYGKDVSFNLVSIMNDVRVFTSSEAVDRADEEDYVSGLPDEDNAELLHLPFWIRNETADGSFLTVKSHLTFNMRDIWLLGISFAVMTLFIGIILVILLVNIIVGIVRRRRTLNVFFTDVVTKGHNMMWLLIKGEEQLKKLRNLSVKYALVNLDFVNYRNFCVCHSVEEGEQVLFNMYGIIAANTDRKREMCAHGGSSDFALIMRFNDEQALERRLQTLIEKLSVTDPDHVFSFHAGVVVIEPDGTVGKDGVQIHRRSLDLEREYINACTAAETLDGTEGSGIAFFDSKIVEDQKWIDVVHEHQRTALENEEFIVYYQPKYDPKTDELRGAEALIRWQSPEYGLVSPGRFIPIFEKNGFITEIDHYMIEHVARDQKMWLDAGYHCVPVSVNVSRAHFIESDLAEQIRDMVDRYGTPHDLIEIELTESAFFDDKKAMINTIGKLKSYGFAVSMDDFGSGYSSLNSLKDMPLDVLKLDAEFFRGENGGERGEIVVAEAIRLAKSLNMRTVAEGVEVRNQVDFLADQGCDMIQGYFYAKPMPSNEYEERMRAGRRPKSEIV